MRKKHYFHRRLYFLSATLLLTLTLSGCGTTTAQQPDEPALTEPTYTGQVLWSSPGNTISIVTRHYEGASDPADTSHRYTYQYEQPTIVLEQSPEAQAAIQADLDQQIAAFLHGLKSEDFGAIYEGQPPAESAYQRLTVSVMRADDQIISLQLSTDGFNNGAHGWHTVGCYNYYTQTGERITFDSLSPDFRSQAEALVLAKAQTMQEQEQCFFADFANSIPLVVLDGTEDVQALYTSLYGEGDYSGLTLEPTFYITDAGITFLSNEYVLQPYAAGTIELPIEKALLLDCCPPELFPAQ